MKSKFILFSFLTAILFSGAVFSQDASDLQTVKVKATVLAYSPFARLRFVVGQTTTYFYEDVLIRVEEDTGELKKGMYIRFRYDHQESKAHLPEKMFEKKKIWEFTLSRSEKCDRVLKDLLYYELDGKTNEYLRRTPWAEKEVLPLEEKVFCYELKIDDYKEF